MRTLGCLKISESNYPVMWHHIPEKQNSHLPCCANQKSQCIHVSKQFTKSVSRILYYHTTSLLCFKKERWSWTIGDRSSLVRDPSLSCSSLRVENEVWNEKYTQRKAQYIYSKINHYNVWSRDPFLVSNINTVNEQLIYVKQPPKQ